MSLKVLLVDDSPSNLFTLRSILESLPVETFSALSGNEALQVLATNEEIGLALLDVHMPDMNGYDLASLMRGVSKTSHIPIIFVTGDVNQGHEGLVDYGEGALDVIYKPVNPHLLRSKVQIFIRLNEKKIRLTQKIAELEEARAIADAASLRARDANRLKSAYLASISHEIRTPLTAITGFAELLRKLHHEDKQAFKYIDIILRSSKNIVHIVNDVLDLSKIEADQLKIETSQFPLRASLEESIELMRTIAQSNGVTVTLKCASNLPETIENDKTRFQQIFLNLLSNAIKFSKRATVAIFAEYSPTQEKDGRPKIRISVEDTGIGIDTENQNSLFRPFSQADTGIFHRFGGTGLGLALSKKLSALLGGDVWLERSVVNEGSLFIFECSDFTSTLPRPVQSSPGFRTYNANLSGLRILFVDDSLDNQLLLRTVFEELGVNLEVSDDGNDCLKRVQHEQYDVILMDYQMPGLSGIEATRQLKAIGSKTPVILLTANAMKGEKENALAAGASAYITKPIHWPDLWTAIQESVKAPSLPSTIEDPL